MRWVCTASADCCLRRRVTEMIIIMTLCVVFCSHWIHTLVPWYHVVRCKQNASPQGGQGRSRVCILCGLSV